MGDNMDEARTSSMSRRTLRTGIIVGVIGVLAMLFSNLFMQSFGVASLNGPNAFFVILTQLYLIAARQTTSHLWRGDGDCAPADPSWR